MAARTIVTDSGGTERLVKRAIAIDSGGTARVAKRIFIVDSGGTSRLVYQALSVQLFFDSYSRIQNTASFTVGNDGIFYATDGGASSAIYDWLLAGDAADVEVRVTPTSGSYSTGTTGTWLSLAFSRTWTRDWSGGMSVNTVQSTVELRNATSEEVLATATITIVATP